MTNREFIQKLLACPGSEEDFEFVFRAGQYLGRPEEVFDYADWLDSDVDPKVIASFNANVS